MQLPRTREWRESRGLTQRELAARASIGPATIPRIERGESVLPNTARKLANALGIEVVDLLGDPPRPSDKKPTTSPRPETEPVDDERRTPSREQTADERMLLEEAKKRWVQIEWDVSHFEKLNEETRTSIEERFDAIVELLNELDIEWVDSEKFDDLLKMLHLSSKYMRTVLELELERKRTNGSTEAEIVDLREASQRIAELRRRSA